MKLKPHATSQHYSVLLVGAGHAHLVLLCSHLDKLVPYGNVAVLAPRFFLYSSLISSCLAGDTNLEDCCIDIQALCHALGVTFLDGSATEIELSERRVRYSGGVLSYDVCSIAIGSHQRPRKDSFGVKSYDAFTTLGAYLARLETTTSYQVEVLGGGATGCEVAYALHRLSEKRQLSLQIRVISNFPILANWHRSTQVRVRHTLETAGIELIRQSGSTQLSKADFRINCTGVLPSVIKGLPVGPQHAIQAHNTLAVANSNETCFAAGDCVEFFEHSLQRLGVYPVRQASILGANLKKSLQGDSRLQMYRPQATVLQILNLHRNSILQWGVPGGEAFVLSGHFPQLLKIYLDSRYMRWITSKFV
jgi:NADH dehydrogenase FAD-containing subunit